MSLASISLISSCARAVCHATWNGYDRRENQSVVASGVHCTDPVIKYKQIDVQTLTAKTKAACQWYQLELCFEAKIWVIWLEVAAVAFAARMACLEFSLLSDVSKEKSSYGTFGLDRGCTYAIQVIHVYPYSIQVSLSDLGASNDKCQC